MSSEQGKWFLLQSVFLMVVRVTHIEIDKYLEQLVWERTFIMSVYFVWLPCYYKTMQSNKDAIE